MPANIIPAVAAFASVYAYTRLLAPADYGLYSLVVSIAMLGQAGFFFWVQSGATRFYARAELDDRTEIFCGTIYKGVALSALVALIVYTGVLFFGHFSPSLNHGLWLGLPLLLTRSLVGLNQAFNRGAARILRYNLTECCQTLLGLLFGIVLLKVFHGGAQSVLLGLIAGALVGTLFDARAVWRGLFAPIDLAMLKSLASFGAPLTICCALAAALNSGDRLIIEYVLGSADVGVYAVAFNTVDRSIGSIFIAVGIAAFPLAARALEANGTAAASKQMTTNGIFMLSLTLPACAGMIAAGPQIAEVLIGAAFRTEALKIMPLVVASSLMSGLQTHYFDHAFLLGSRTKMLIFSLSPAVITSVVLTTTLSARMGLTGAVWSAVTAHAVALGMSIWLGRRSLRFAFPFAQALRIAIACAAMMAVLRVVDLPATPLGLVALISLGVVVYGVMYVVLDVGGVRRHLADALRGFGLIRTQDGNHGESDVRARIARERS
jgi:O-antigen/teichoic acid export membrane protein